MAVNYQMDVINPFQAALQGYGAGAQMLQQERQVGQENQLFQAQMAEQRARAAQVQAEMAAAEERNALYGEFYDAVEAGNLTPAMVAKVTALDDKLGTYGAEMMANLSTEQKRASFGNLMAPATALATGDIEAAKSNLQTQYDALVNAGDEQGAKAVKGYLDQLGTPQGQTFVQAALLRGASMMDPAGFKAQVDSIKRLNAALDAPTQEKVDNAIEWITKAFNVIKDKEKSLVALINIISFKKRIYKVYVMASLLKSNDKSLSLLMEEEGFCVNEIEISENINKTISLILKKDYTQLNAMTMKSVKNDITLSKPEHFENILIKK
jgi:hypothetical protein